MTDDKTKILFIGGPGRSGSTLLDRVIGTDQNYFSAGELCFFWNRSLYEKLPCGCKETVFECEVWREVLKTAFGGESRLDVMHMRGLSQQLYRRKNLLSFMVPSLRSAQLAENLLEFGDVLQALLDGVRKVTHCPVIIDSSNNPMQGFLLQALGRFNIRAVHLTRDSRGVAHSWRKTDLQWPTQGDSKSYMPVFTSRQSAFWWMHHNLLMELYTLRYGNVLFLQYEEFANSPLPSIRKIFKHAWGMNVGSGHINGRTVDLGINHLVSGNPNRFDEGPQEIRIDDKWVTDLPLRERRQVTNWSASLLWAYGYIGSEKRKDAVLNNDART